MFSPACLYFSTVPAHVVDLIAGAVCYQTQKTYRPARDLWIQYWLPQGNASDNWMYLISDVDFSHRQRVWILIDFLHWMIAPPQSVAASVACHHFTGLRFMFRNHITSLEPFSDESLTKAKESTLTKSNKEIRERKATYQILPLVINDLAELRQRFFMDASASLHERMTCVAIAAGFNVTLRIGEVAYGGPYEKWVPDFQASDPVLLASERVTPPLVWTEVKGDHRLFLCDIYLEDTTGVSYSYLQYIDLAPEARPIIEYMKWDSGSTKSSRRQHDKLAYHFGRGSPLESQFLDDFLWFLHHRGRTTADLQIFSCVSHSKRADQLTKNLTERMVREMIKHLKASHGFDPRNFSGKSQRMGGATSYAASGRSTADTLANTGHKNLSTTLIYTNTAGTTGNALSNTAVITDKDLKRTLPANQRVHGAAGTRKK